MIVQPRPGSVPLLAVDARVMHTARSILRHIRLPLPRAPAPARAVHLTSARHPLEPWRCPWFARQREVKRRGRRPQLPTARRRPLGVGAGHEREDSGAPDAMRAVICGLLSPVEGALVREVELLWRSPPRAGGCTRGRGRDIGSRRCAGSIDHSSIRCERVRRSAGGRRRPAQP